jgi:hypothetical protein
MVLFHVQKTPPTGANLGPVFLLPPRTNSLLSLSMTRLSEYDTLDPDLLQRLAAVNLDDVASPVACPPRTSPPRSPPPYRSPPSSLSPPQLRPPHRTLPHNCPSTITSSSPRRNTTVYRVESPTLRGVTTEW